MRTFASVSFQSVAVIMTGFAVYILAQVRHFWQVTNKLRFSLTETLIEINRIIAKQLQYCLLDNRLGTPYYYVCLLADCATAFTSSASSILNPALYLHDFLISRLLLDVSSVCQNVQHRRNNSNYAEKLHSGDVLMPRIQCELTVVQLLTRCDRIIRVTVLSETFSSHPSYNKNFCFHSPLSRQMAQFALDCSLREVAVVNSQYQLISLCDLQR